MSSNNTPLHIEQQKVPAPFPLQLEQVKAIVDDYINNCLWYKIECTDAETAAQKLNVKTDTVRHYIKDGLLPASKIGNAWCIRLVDIDKLLTDKQHTTKIIPITRRKRSKNVL